MRYLLKSTYTPDDPDSDRSRKKAIVSDANDLIDAIRQGLSILEMSTLVDEVIQEHLEQSAEDDTSEGSSWVVGANNGEYHYEIEPFEASDPVTEEAILEWAQEQQKEWNRQPDNPMQPTAHASLRRLLGRAYWRTIDQWSEFDLKQALHDMVTGESDKEQDYRRMNLEKLTATVMVEIVEGQRDCYDEAKEGVPFGMAAMIENDRELWLNES